MTTKNKPNADADKPPRRQPPAYKRKARAKNAARQRWKHKQRLTPGVIVPWCNRSVANEERHLAAAKRGGETTKRKLAEQMRLFWNWYHGETKGNATGPARAIIDTFERIEAAYVQRYGRNAYDADIWLGFMFYACPGIVGRAAWTREEAEIEQVMWKLYNDLTEADAVRLAELLQPMWEAEDAKEARAAMFQVRGDQKAIEQ